MNLSSSFEDFSFVGHYLFRMDKKTYFDRKLKVEYGKGGNRGEEHYTSRKNHPIHHQQAHHYSTKDNRYDDNYRHPKKRKSYSSDNRSKSLRKKSTSRDRRDYRESDGRQGPTDKYFQRNEKHSEGKGDAHYKSRKQNGSKHFDRKDYESKGERIYNDRHRYEKVRRSFSSERRSRSYRKRSISRDRRDHYRESDSRQGPTDKYYQRRRDSRSPDRLPKSRIYKDQDYKKHYQREKRRDKSYARSYERSDDRSRDRHSRERKNRSHADKHYTTNYDIRNIKTENWNDSYRKQ